MVLESGGDVSSPSFSSDTKLVLFQSSQFFIFYFAFFLKKQKLFKKAIFFRVYMV